jgi:hypothetical protein
VILALCSDVNGSSTSNALYATPLGGGETVLSLVFGPMTLGGTGTSGAAPFGGPLSATIGAMYERTGSLTLRIILRSQARPTVVETKLFVTLCVRSTRSGSPHSATM